MLTVPPTTKLWFAGGVDLRLGFEGLANRVRGRLNADPAGGHLFVFTNRSANRVKVLYWGGRGLSPWCQRLESGRYPFPPVTYGRLGASYRALADLYRRKDRDYAEPRLRECLLGFAKDYDAVATPCPNGVERSTPFRRNCPRWAER